MSLNLKIKVFMKIIPKFFFHETTVKNTTFILAYHQFGSRTTPSHYISSC